MSAQANSSDPRAKPTIDEDAHETYSQVNPLWMITVGLACFFMLILLVLSP